MAKDGDNNSNGDLGSHAYQLYIELSLLFVTEHTPPATLLRKYYTTLSAEFHLK